MAAWSAGFVIVTSTSVLPTLRERGWQPLGPIVGIALIVFSLFGDLPPSLAWLQRLGSVVFPGVAAGTIAILLALLVPTGTRPTSLLAFSPAVWAAYFSIIAVGISFELSALPAAILQWCEASRLAPSVLIPLYVVVIGLLGNVFDGVTIIAISVVIFLVLLPGLWAARASFALLFGGLVSNMITVAAEPTNIKFQDVLGSLLDRVRPAFWATNWPISVLGILLPAIGLGIWMTVGKASWRERKAPPEAAFPEGESAPDTIDAKHEQRQLVLSVGAIVLLAAGIIVHSIFEVASAGHGGNELPLWPLLLPAGIVALFHIGGVRELPEQLRDLAAESTNGQSYGLAYLREQWPVWGKIALIFSLIWFLGYLPPSRHDIFGLFFAWPLPFRYGIMMILSLLSSVTDNVALASMQGALIINHPLAIWQVRLLLILLTWAGGLTYFGCLQSLALNSRLKLSTMAWVRQTAVWAVLSIVGALAGLVLIALLYPHSIGLVH